MNQEFPSPGLIWVGRREGYLQKPSILTAWWSPGNTRFLPFPTLNERLRYGLQTPKSTGTKRMEEITAYHEAGHAVMAKWLGGRIVSITIEPDDDDGPRRFGDIRVQWLHPLPAREDAVRNIQVSLAGPVAEMIYDGQRQPIAFRREWSADWQMAAECAAPWLKSRQHLGPYLDRMTAEVFQFIYDDHRWAAVAALADELLAHETLEADAIDYVLSFWL